MAMLAGLPGSAVRRAIQRPVWHAVAVEAASLHTTTTTTTTTWPRGAACTAAKTRRRHQWGPARQQPAQWHCASALQRRSLHGVAGTCSGSTAPDAGTEDDVGAAEAVKVVPAELDDDPYDWLHHPTQSALDLIERENQLTVDAMKHTSRLQKSLLKELKFAHSARTDKMVGEIRDGFEYYRRGPVDKEHMVLCRKPVDGGREEVLLDLNELAEHSGFVHVAAEIYSRDGDTMAFLCDLEGQQTQHVYVKNLRTGQMGQVLKDAHGIAFDDPTTPSAVLASVVRRGVGQLVAVQLDGVDAVAKRRLWSTPRNLNVNALLLVAAGDGSMATMLALHYPHVLGSYLLRTTRPGDQEVDWNAPYRHIAPVQLDCPDGSSENMVLVHKDTALMLPADGTAVYGAVASQLLAAGQVPQWDALVPPREGVIIRTLDATEHGLVLRTDADAASFMEVWPWAWLAEHEADECAAVGVPPPLSGTAWDEGHASLAHETGEPYSVCLYSATDGVEDVTFEVLRGQANTARLAVAHPARKLLLADFDVASGATAVRSEKKRTWESWMGKMFERTYESYRVLATAADGTKIPITIAHRTDVSHDRRNPCLLSVYGSYGQPLETAYSPALRPLLARGWVLAYAHVRGGSEMGDTWHEAGRGANKMNTVTDFVTCLKHLIDDVALTSPQRVVLHGASAGAVPVAYALNEHPGLMGGAILDTPFLDVLSSVANEDVNPNVADDRVEWGNPTVPEERRAIEAYDPYSNVGAHAYPPMLVVAAWDDERTPYWHAAKFVARVLDTRTNDTPLLLNVRQGGHVGGSQRLYTLLHASMLYAFMFWALDLPLK